MSPRGSPEGSRRAAGSAPGGYWAPRFSAPSPCLGYRAHGQDCSSSCVRRVKRSWTRIVRISPLAYSHVIPNGTHQFRHIAQICTALHCDTVGFGSDAAATPLRESAFQAASLVRVNSTELHRGPIVVPRRPCQFFPHRAVTFASGQNSLRGINISLAYPAG
jgi:hypothetical protein